MSKPDMEKILDGLGSDDPTLAELIRAAASRAFWLIALLASSAALIVVTVAGQSLGIRPSDHEWTATAMIVGFLASAGAMILCVVMWIIRHVQRHCRGVDEQISTDNILER